MLVTYVLRLHVTELQSGRMVGVVEDVTSGERNTIRDASELIEFCAAHLGQMKEDGGMGR